MTTLNDHFPDTLLDLTVRLHAFDDASVDPDFDFGIEELDRQFTELRFVRND